MFKAENYLQMLKQYIYFTPQSRQVQPPSFFHHISFPILPLIISLLPYISLITFPVLPSLLPHFSLLISYPFSHLPSLSLSLLPLPFHVPSVFPSFTHTLIPYHCLLWSYIAQQVIFFRLLSRTCRGLFPSLLSVISFLSFPFFSFYCSFLHIFGSRLKNSASQVQPA